MHTARLVDRMEHQLVGRGEAFFHASGAGHEAVAALAACLQPDDYLHCHYRDKALLLARGVPIVEFFNTVLCNAAGGSAGRQLSPLLSVPAVNVLPIVGPVANNALQSAGIAAQIRNHPTRPLVVCSLGDGGTQQGEFLEAVAEAVRWSLPVLFLIEDNQYAISTRTPGRTFFSLPDGDAPSFMGLPIHRFDGRDARACATGLQPVVERIRSTRGPALCVLSMERLADHSNADDEEVYRNREERALARSTGDPVSRLRTALLTAGHDEAALQAIEQAAEAAVHAAAEAALRNPPPIATSQIGQVLSGGATPEFRGGPGVLTMTEALRETLRARLLADARVSLYGQDIEDPKGDVFGVTRGLSSAFPGRVRNAPLSESTILGTSIGRALAGGRPVAFLQFADFLPLAFNQLATELATLNWRSNGGWSAPVIVLAACGAYRPGLGPFHAHTWESVLAHLPGIDVGMPSSAADAAGMLNAAFASERPTVILYPKALLNDRERTTSADVSQQIIPVGRARCVLEGTDLTLVGWGNTLPLCEKVAAALAAVAIAAEVLDLRWMTPFDREAVCASARKTRRLLVVHEDNMTAGFGAEVLASVAETLDVPIQYRRLGRADTYVPCHFGNQLEILPSFESLLTAAAEMLGLGLRWDRPAVAGANRMVVTAIGSSPADQQVEVVELLVKVGDRVQAGQPLATLEADKAMVELVSPADGSVEALHLQIGDRAAVDAPLLTLAVVHARQRQPTRENPGTPRLTRPAGPTPRSAPATQAASSTGLLVTLTGLGVVRGRDRLHNRDLLPRFPAFTAGGTDGIFERTGIESRVVADDTQDAISMAAEAAGLALAEAGITARDLQLIICSTSTPVTLVPSTACLVLHRLNPELQVPAYDLLAACTGYLYALSAAWDFVQTRPGANVLVLTTEVMRRIINPNDADTSPIFGDAATATIINGSDNGRVTDSGLAVLHRPLINARGEDGSTLLVPLPGPGARVRMEGRRVFSEAVRRMNEALTAACAESGISIADLDVIVPHQANGRIIEAMRTRLKLPPERVWNEIRQCGNTSSSSIPLALDTVLRRPRSGERAGGRIGLCAFGGGFTWGGAILSTGRLKT